MNRATIRRVTTFGADRRSLFGAGIATVLGGSVGVGGAIAQDGATPVASPVAASGRPHLVVADRNANALYVYSIPDFALTGQLEGIGFGIHAGSFLLEDGRLVFADTLNDEIVALAISDAGQPTIVQRAPAVTGGNVAWMAAHPSLSHLVVGSLIEDGESQFLNVLDLGRFENTSIEFAMEEPEEIHGWLLGDPIHLYVAVGGRIDSYRLDDLLAGNADPLGTVPVDLDSHGGATDARNDRIFYTTGPGAGFDVLDAADGVAEYATQIPWDLDGLSGGRNARPRVLRDGRHIFGVMTPGLDDPTVWAETTVSNHVTDMDDLSAVRVPVAVGTIGYRWGLADGIALWAGYDADGARAYLIDAVPGSETFGTSVGTIDVAMPSNAATPGEDYEGAEFYLMTAVTPDGAHGFVTISGDGLIQAVDLRSREVVADIETPSPLAGGGYTTVVQAGVAPVDLWGR